MFDGKRKLLAIVILVSIALSFATVAQEPLTREEQAAQARELTHEALGDSREQADLLRASYGEVAGQAIEKVEAQPALKVSSTMFSDGAWLGWSIFVGSAIASMLLFGFLLPLRKKDEEDDRLYSQSLIKRGTDKHGVRWSEEGIASLIAPQGGLFRIDCGLNIPPGRTVGALYKTPIRLQGKAYVYSVGNYLPKPLTIPIEALWDYLTEYRRKTIERGVEVTLPLTPEKQKGHAHALEGMGDQVKSDNQPLQNEARREMQQRRRPRRVLMPREHPSDSLLGHGITSIPKAYGLEDELRAFREERDA